MKVPSIVKVHVLATQFLFYGSLLWKPTCIVLVLRDYTLSAVKSITQDLFLENPALKPTIRSEKLNICSPPDIHCFSKHQQVNAPTIVFKA